MKLTYAKKWILFTVFMAVIAFGLARLYYYLTDDFHLGNITYKDMPFTQQNADAALTDNELLQLKDILNQKFYYLDKGAQSYAFQSADQQYVLKFFKFKHLKPHWLIENLPSISPLNHFKEHTRIRKQRKLAAVFEGYETAYQYNKEGSQLIFLHLNPTDYLQQTTTVLDKMGREHAIELDPVVFLVQKKGEPLRNRLKTALNQGNIEAAQTDLTLILDMYRLEYQKGIYDRDHGVLQNTGLIAHVPFHLDVGKMTKNEQMKEVSLFKKDLELVIWRIELWLKAHYPQAYTPLSIYLAAEYLRLTGEPLDISQMTPELARSRRLP